MTARNWAERARQFIDADSKQWAEVNGDAELRMATIDIHSAIEDTLRWYLDSVYRLTEVLEKNKYSFPAVIKLLHQYTGNAVIDAEMSERLLHFNALRNRVVHEGYIPSRSQVQEGLQCTTSVLHRLLRKNGGRSSVQPQERGVRYSGVTPVLATAALVFFGLAALYVILPDLLPFNPIDDIIVSGPCLLIAIILGGIALALRKRR